MLFRDLITILVSGCQLTSIFVNHCQLTSIDFDRRQLTQIKLTLKSIFVSFRQIVSILVNNFLNFKSF